MRYISVSFHEDLHRDDTERFKHIAGCLGVSSYRNTLNLYFKTITRQTLFHLALALQQHVNEQGSGVLLAGQEFTLGAQTQAIYGALREEALL